MAKKESASEKITVKRQRGGHVEYLLRIQQTDLHAREVPPRITCERRPRRTAHWPSTRGLNIFLQLSTTNNDHV